MPSTHQFGKIILARGSFMRYTWITSSHDTVILFIIKNDSFTILIIPPDGAYSSLNHIRGKELHITKKTLSAQRKKGGSKLRGEKVAQANVIVFLVSVRVYLLYILIHQMGFLLYCE